MQRCSTLGSIFAATSRAEVTITPSISSTRSSAAACSIAPTMVAISKPPRDASASSASPVSGFAASASRSTAILRCTPSEFSPVPAPVQSTRSTPCRRASSSEADEVLPIPISPSIRALPGRPRTSSWPLRIACRHCSIVMAGPWLQSAVPGATLHTRSASRGAKSCATPQSTTVSAMPCCFASTLTAAPPARKFSTICQVTSCGKAETPRLTRPWSPANTTI